MSLAANQSGLRWRGAPGYRRGGLRCRGGFTFTEVMFAVIILGGGFVMIAAILPVAIQQTKSNVDEATASAISQAAVNAITQSTPAAPSQVVTPVVTTPPTAIFPPTSVNDAGTGVLPGAPSRLYYFGGTTVGSTGEQANPNIAATPNTYLAPDEQINALIGNMIFPAD